MEGENLRQAKSRIESTMDAIVKGFEHQLDELYKADAMDVDSDIRVMETCTGTPPRRSGTSAWAGPLPRGRNRAEPDRRAVWARRFFAF